MSFTKNPVSEIASKFISNTNRHIFLTGKAGTGKTTFLRHIKEYTHKNVVVAAPTGIAAINAEGVTLHSLFQLPFGSFIPTDATLSDNINIQLSTPKSLISKLQMHSTKRNMIKEIELLIIDEVSMLRADLLDAIDVILRSVRRKRLPFGGVQVLFIGDLLQLPPVVKDNEWQILSQFYSSMFFFNAKVLQQNPPIYIELDKIYRQSDPKFISVLNNLRDNKVTNADIELLNSYHKPDFQPLQDEQYINLTTHNAHADEKNRSSLDELPGKSFFFDAIIERDFNEHLYPIDPKLELKKDAQVMFIKNDYSGEGRYFNGKIGYISQLDSDEIIVSFKDGSEPTSVDRYVWENKKFKLNKETNAIEEEIVGTFSQYPLKLAWSITVHKSQGLTFEKAVIDVSKAFAPGQIYVALSRLTSLDGLVLSTKLPTHQLEQDDDLHDFSNNKKAIPALQDELQQSANEFLKNQVLQSFDFGYLFNSVRYHYESYNKEEGKSIKQQFKPWAAKLVEDTKPLKEVADKFSVELRKITQSGNNSSHLLTRIDSAKNYFEPLLRDFSKKITERIKDLSSQKRIKKYLNELQDVERMYFRQLQLIYKAEALVDSSLNNTEVSKETLLQQGLYKDRDKLTTKTKKKSSKSTGTKTKKEKKEKGPNTKEITYNLFNEGMTVKEICKERGLTAQTIEGHLAHYIKEGKLDVLEFMTQKELDEIVNVAEELETTSLGPIKEILLDDYTWAQIRMAIAHYTKTLEEFKED